MESSGRWSLDGGAPLEGEGVGVFMQSDEGDQRVYVKKVVSGGSAARSGRVEVGDVIVRVDGMDVSGETVAALRRRIVGPPGSFVRLGFRRHDQEFEVRLMRGSPEFIHVNLPKASELLPGSRVDVNELELAAQRARAAEAQRDTDRLELDRLRSHMHNDRDTSMRYVREIDAMQRKHSDEVLALQTVLNKSEQQRRELEHIVQVHRSREEETRQQLLRAKDALDQRELQLGEFRRAFEEERTRLERELLREKEARREEQASLANAEQLLQRMQEQIKRAKEIERARCDRDERIKSHINDEFARLNDARILEEKIMGQTQELHLMLNKWESDFFSGMAPPAPTHGERPMMISNGAVHAERDEHYFMA